jgi:hypothetical protein
LPCPCHSPLATRSWVRLPRMLDCCLAVAGVPQDSSSATENHPQSSPLAARSLVRLPHMLDCCSCGRHSAGFELSYRDNCSLGCWVGQRQEAAELRALHRQIAICLEYRARGQRGSGHHIVGAELLSLWLLMSACFSHQFHATSHPANIKPPSSRSTWQSAASNTCCQRWSQIYITSLGRCVIYTIPLRVIGTFCLFILY